MLEPGSFYLAAEKAESNVSFPAAVHFLPECWVVYGIGTSSSCPRSLRETVWLLPAASVPSLSLRSIHFLRS